MLTSYIACLFTDKCFVVGHELAVLLHRMTTVLL